MTDLRSFAEMLVDAEKRIAELEAALREVSSVALIRSDASLEFIERIREICEKTLTR